MDGPTGVGLKPRGVGCPIRPNLARPFRTPGSPWTVWAFLAVTAAMLASFARESPRPTMLSLGVVALGMIVYRAPRAPGG